MSGPTLDHIFHDHGSYIRRTLLRRGVPSSDLPDVEQDVYLHALRSLSTFDPSRSSKPANALRNWLFGICKHLAHRHRRRQVRMCEVSLEELDEHEFPSDDQNGEEAHAARELTSTLESALARLPSKYRAVVSAYAFEGLPMSEVAAMLGIPANTVWTRYRLARRRLRDAAQRSR